ncbi:MAG: luciferase family protein [Sandaracinaceae bacterium]
MADTNSPARALLAAAAEAAEVERKPSRFGPPGSPALFVEGREVLHLHGEDEIDLRLTRREIRRCRQDLRADARFVIRRAGGDWVEVTVSESEIAELLPWVRRAIEANRA